MAPAAEAVRRAIIATDFTRGCSAAVPGHGRHKEWQHFVVLSREIDLLVNFSVCDDVRPGAPRGAAFPRIVLLVRNRTWDGDVEAFEPSDVRINGGSIDFAFANNRLVFRDGVFHIDVALQRRPIALHLELTPLTMPAFVPNIPMLDGPPLHWVAVPRLTAAGWVTIGGHTYGLDGAPAYHDHNWGDFLWGHDVSWEWGFVLPDEPDVPWSVTFVRLTNRARTVALSQGFFVWNGEQHVRVFRDRDIQVRTDLTLLRRLEPFKIPRIMALVAPETTTDVPRSVTVRGEADGDWIECAAEGCAVAQVLIPSEVELGVTIFNEVRAQARVCGRTGGEEFAFTGRALLEFIRVW